MEERKNVTKLEWVRKMRGLSQTQLAAKAGLSVMVIRHAEQRFRRIDGMRAETLWHIATALEVPMETLLEHDEEK